MTKKKTEQQRWLAFLSHPKAEGVLPEGVSVKHGVLSVSLLGTHGVASLFHINDGWPAWIMSMLVCAAAEWLMRLGVDAELSSDDNGFYLTKMENGKTVPMGESGHTLSLAVLAACERTVGIE